MSDTNRVSLAYALEPSYAGSTSAVVMQYVRYTSESLKQVTSNTRSAEIRDDRQISNVPRVNIGAQGDVGVEFSYGAHDTWLAASLQSAGWSSIVTVGPSALISAAGGDNSFNSAGGLFSGVSVNQWVRSSGWVNTNNNGYFKITSQTANKIIVAGLNALTTEATGPSVTIVQGAQIVNGTNQPSYCIEKKFTDLTNKWEKYVGMTLGGFTWTITTQQIGTGSFSFMGKSAASAAATSGSGSFTAAPTADVLNAVDNVLAILENMGDFDATEFSFTVADNLRARSQIGDLGSTSIGAGSLNVTGKVRAYFTTPTIIDKNLNYTTSSLAIIQVDSAGNAYIIDLPRLKYTDSSRVAGGQNADVMADMSFEAYMHPTETITIRIVRFAA